MNSIQCNKCIVQIINARFPCSSLQSFGNVFFFFKWLLLSHFKHVVGVIVPNTRSTDQEQVVIEPVPLLMPAQAVLLCMSVDAATLLQLENSSLIINVGRHFMCLPRFNLTAYWQNTEVHRSVSTFGQQCRGYEWMHEVLFVFTEPCEYERFLADTRRIENIFSSILEYSSSTNTIWVLF